MELICAVGFKGRESYNTKALNCDGVFSTQAAPRTLLTINEVSLSAFQGDLLGMLWFNCVPILWIMKQVTESSTGILSCDH